MPGSRSRGGCDGSPRCRVPGPIEPPRSRRARARLSGGRRPRGCRRRSPRQRSPPGPASARGPVTTSASSRLLHEPAGGRVLADLRRDGGARGIGPTTCEAPRRRIARRRARPLSRPASGRSPAHEPVCPRRDPGNLARSWLSNNRLRVRDGARRHRGARRRTPVGARCLEPRRVSARIGRGMAGHPVWAYLVVTVDRIRAARGGDAPGRLGAPDVRASRARLRPPRRARERVAGGAPDEPSHRHLLLALRDRRRLRHPGARGGHHPRRGRAPQVAGGARSSSRPSPSRRRPTGSRRWRSTASARTFAAWTTFR